MFEITETKKEFNARMKRFRDGDDLIKETKRKTRKRIRKIKITEEEKERTKKYCKKYQENLPLRQKIINKEKQKLHLANRTPEQKEKHKRQGILKRYNITLIEYDRLFKKQKSRCAICNTFKPRKKRNGLVVDHEHSSGKVRGLLCFQCNIGLGNFKDDINLLKKAIEYLETRGDKNPCIF